ncbi:purine-cytosine permease family protein [Mycolicibacterium helvum]|uniref:Transporter membrane subunit n=1 Tax=Mycolicibacterium helvum TaxID=1534349 RepID=A0A7I7TBN7_9MYCO|nr:cytosine permease [Mycolicibacterium helvum]BBY65891.1 transporter membrane subunit [Mycolicibacterium helvum]
MQPEATATSTWRSGIEGRSIEWIPPDERHGKVRQQGPFWFLCNFHPLTVALGLVGPTLGLSLLWTIVAVIAGVLFGTVFLALHGSQGPNLGLPQMIQSRAQLGYRGVVVILFAAVFTFLGYNVVDTVMIDAGFHNLFGWNSTITGLGVGVGAIVLAVWGHDWLHRAFTVMFWVSLPLWLILTFGALFGGSGGAPVADLGFRTSAFVVMFTIGATYNITYAPIVSDYTRYLPVNVSSRALIMTVYWGAAIAAIWMMALGAWLGARFGVADTFVGIHDATNAVMPWAGTVLVVISGLALVSTMGLNTYSATLTVLTAIDCFVPRFSTPLRRAITAVVLGAVSTAIGVWVVHDISAAISNALLIMLYLLAPWTAINLVDYFIVRRGHYDVAEILNPGGVYGNWAWRGLTAYGLGVAAEIPFITLTFYHGPIARALGGIDIAFAVSLVVAGIAFYILSRRFTAACTETTPISLRARPRPHTAPGATAKENTP